MDPTKKAPNSSQAHNSLPDRTINNLSKRSITEKEESSPLIETKRQKTDEKPNRTAILDQAVAALKKTDQKEKALESLWQVANVGNDLIDNLALQAMRELIENGISVKEIFDRIILNQDMTKKMIHLLEANSHHDVVSKIFNYVITENKDNFLKSLDARSVDKLLNSRFLTKDQQYLCLSFIAKHLDLSLLTPNHLMITNIDDENILQKLDAFYPERAKALKDFFKDTAQLQELLQRNKLHRFGHVFSIYQLNSSAIPLGDTFTPLAINDITEALNNYKEDIISKKLLGGINIDKIIQLVMDISRFDDSNFTAIDEIMSKIESKETFALGHAMTLENYDHLSGLVFHENYVFVCDRGGVVNRDSPTNRNVHAIILFKINDPKFFNKELVTPLIGSNDSHPSYCKIVDGADKTPDNPNPPLTRITIFQKKDQKAYNCTRTTTKTIILVLLLLEVIKRDGKSLNDLQPNEINLYYQQALAIYQDFTLWERVSRIYDYAKDPNANQEALQIAINKTLLPAIERWSATRSYSLDHFIDSCKRMGFIK